VALPHLQLFQLDFSELFSKSGFNPGAWSAVLAYSLVMIFDIGGAMFGLGNLAGGCSRLLPILCSLSCKLNGHSVLFI